MTYQVGPIATLAYIALQVQVIRYALRIRAHSPDAWARHFGSYMVALCAAATIANCISNAFINRTTLGWYFWGLAGLVFAEHQHLVKSRHITVKSSPESRQANAFGQARRSGRRRRLKREPQRGENRQARSIRKCLIEYRIHRIDEFLLRERPPNTPK